MRINFFNQAGSTREQLSSQSSGTLTSALILYGNPVSPLEAAPKQYVDSAITSLNASNIKTGTIPVARLPAFTGDVTSTTGSGSFILANTSVVPGTYTKVTVDIKGRILAGSNITIDDIPPFNFSKIISGKPTTLAGYGITDGVSKNGGILTGIISLNNDPTNNLHAANKQYTDSINLNSENVKVGNIIRRGVNGDISGYLRCNGGEVSKTTYSALYSVVSELKKMNLDYTNYSAIGSGQPWRQQYDININQNSEIGNWATGISLPGPLGRSQAIVTKNRVYLLGGHNGAGHISTVYIAPINADGSLGTWTIGTSLPADLGLSQAIVTKNRVYLIGGRDTNNNVISVVYSAPINVDGTLGTWSTGTSLPIPLDVSQAIATKNRVYLLAGCTTNNTPVSTVYTAPINSDGTLGAWTTTTSLPEALFWSQAVVTKNRVYLLGGHNSNNAVSTVYTAPINADGTLGAWTTGTPLPGAIGQSQTVVTKNRVYLLGGGTSFGAWSSTVYSAPINTDGTLGAWVISNSLPVSLAHSQAIVVKNKIYMLGGWINGTFGFVSNVYVATIYDGLNDYSKFYDGSINKFDGSNVTGLYDIYQNEVDFTQPGNGQPWRQQYQFNTQQDGDITGWTTGTSLPGPLSYSNVLVTKNRVYLLGGWNGTAYASTVYTAPINADGSIGTWAAGTSLPESLGSAQVIVTKNRVYLIGGRTNPGAMGITSVYTAPINNDGTIGAWVSGNSLPTAFGHMQAIVTKNRVYVLGGHTGSDSISTVYSAFIDSSGALGAWVVGTSLPGPLASSKAIVTKNRVYLLGGNNGPTTTTVTSVVYTAPINADGTLGTWTTGNNIPASVMTPVVIVFKNRVYLFGGYGNGGSSSASYSAPINADGTLGAWVSITSLPVTLYSSQMIVTKDRVHVLGGSSGNDSTTISTVYTAPISGGLNSYVSYYDGSIVPADPGSFKLPNLNSLESENEYFFIKH